MRASLTRLSLMTLATIGLLLGRVGMPSSDRASAAEIKVIASGATKEAVVELIPAFEKSSGHKVVPTWTGGANIKKQIAAGEVYDLVIVAGRDIDDFIKDGKVMPGSRVDLMKSGIGVGVREGATQPDIRSSEALKRTILAARSVGYSTGPSGTYVLSMFERMGITDQIKPKLKQVPSGERIGTFIKSGEAEIGFQQISELIHEPGVSYVGPLPPEDQNITVFSAGIHRQAKQPETAKELIRSLTSPAATSIIKKHGMEAVE
jgi:molybdate transport system substrate-binding protein